MEALEDKINDKTFGAFHISNLRKLYLFSRLVIPLENPVPKVKFNII